MQKRQRSILVMVSLFLFAWVLVACGSVFPGVESQPEAPQADSTTPTLVSHPVETEALKATPSDEPVARTDATQSAATQLPGSTSTEAVPPTEEPVQVRQGLAATNPSTVSLASGDLQLVEFFAFW